jgi:hypothetical protein
MRSVLRLARSVLGELDLDVVLKRVLEASRDLTDAKYAALGVLDESRSELARFLTLGIDEATRREIGSLPRGRGVLGELIRNPVPLGGRLWMFHGEPDTGPHRSPGMREHDRHVIDPGTGVDTDIPEQPVADASRVETNGGERAPAPTLTAVPAANPTSAASASASDDLAAEWEQAVPPMDS